MKLDVRQLLPVPVAPGKVLVPRLSGRELQRPLLWRRVLEQPRPQITVLTAPGGYGKTTLATQLITQLPTGTACWLTLDADDDDPLRLAAAVIVAAAAYCADHGAAAAGRLSAGRITEAVTALCEQLAAADAALTFVIDDLHFLTTTSASELLQRLINGAARSVHWLLLGRNEPALPLARWLLEHRLLQLTAADLQLSESETAELLRQSAGLTPEDQTLTAIHRRSEGWPAGLQLTLLAGSRDRQLSAERLLPLLRGDQRLISEYLGSEILVGVPAPLSEFLLYCALPDRLHPALCDAMTERSDSSVLLAEAVRRQLFVQPLDDFGEWFVLHALWREYLAEQALRRLPAAQYAAAALRAAYWLQDNGDTAGALQLLVRTGQAAAAGQLVERHIDAALADYRLEECRIWLRMLPDSVLCRSLVLVTARGWLEFMLGRLVDLGETLRIAGGLKGAAENDDVLVLRALHLLHSGDRRGMFVALWQQREQLAQMRPFAAGWAWLILGSCRQADLVPGIPARDLFAAARQAFQRAGADFGEMYARSLMVVPLRETGELELLLEECRSGATFARRNLHLAAAHEALETFSLLGGEALWWMNRSSEAVGWFAEAYRDARTMANSTYSRQAAIWLEICRADGVAVDFPAPITEALDWVDDQSVSSVVIGERGTLLLLMSLLALRRSEMQPYCRRAAQTLQLPAGAAGVELPDSVYISSALFRLVTRQLPLESPTALLAGRQLEALDPRRLQLFLLVFGAVAARRDGQPQYARALLRRAVMLLDQVQYRRLPLLFAELHPVLRTIDLPSAQQLIGRIDAAPLSGPLLSDREVLLLRLMAGGARQAEIASQLMVSVATVKWYLQRIYRRLGLHGRRAAVQWAREHL